MKKKRDVKKAKPKHMACGCGGKEWLLLPTGHLACSKCLIESKLMLWYYDDERETVT